MTVPPPSGSNEALLATDLDGTLLPLPDDPGNAADLRLLCQDLDAHSIPVLYVTGRHVESAQRALQAADLPTPRALICDVGTCILEGPGPERFVPVPAYSRHLDEITSGFPIQHLRERLAGIEGLRLQEEEKQGTHKLSFYALACDLDELVARVDEDLTRFGVPFSLVHSVDPFTGDGLIDVLPSGVSKAFALDWWVRRAGVRPESVVFAGDSGNDFSALTAGYRAIVVGNADRRLARRVWDEHRRSGWSNRLRLARARATSGVLEGCRWFGLVPGPCPAVPKRWGATPIGASRTHFRVWAPARDRVEVELVRPSRPGDTDHDGESPRFPLRRDRDGTFSGTLPVEPGSRYRYRVNEKNAFPDPATRFQPEGVHGPSQVVDADSFAWTDDSWPGLPKRDLIIYELHIGTFTEQGTFRSAVEKLPLLVELGVTAVEIMPVAQTPGRWAWGYEGVHLFSVRNTYGSPEDFKVFVNECHELGLAVLLDVVYNHVGPEGNYLAEFGPYLSTMHTTPWGEAFNYDEEGSEKVRRFVIDNALEWIADYHLDGLRLDSVHHMEDDSDAHILREIRDAVAACAETVGRPIHLIAEANVFDRRLLSRADGQLPYDAIWCDCLMHSLYSIGRPDLRLTEREYRGARDLLPALRRGYVFSGPPTERLASNDEAWCSADGPSPISSLVVALQTHDGIGSHPLGHRIHHLTSREFQMAAATLILLHPGVPLLFMGEERALETPFPFFCEFEDPAICEAMDRSRAREHPEERWGELPSPSREDTFRNAKWRSDRAEHAAVLDWYRKLILLRKRLLSAGMLDAERFEAHHEPETRLWMLRFARDGGGGVEVRVRLDSAEGEDNGQTSVRIPGKVILSSKELSESGSERFWMHPNHAVVSEGARWPGPVRTPNPARGG